MKLLNIACHITLVRIALVPGALALVFLGRPPAYLAAALVCALAGITDIVDGYIARRFCGETRLGATLDLAADKLLVLGVVGALGAQGLLPLWVPALLTLRETAVAGLRLGVARGGDFVAPDAWGKAKTAVSVVALVGILLGEGLSQGTNATPGSLFVVVAALLSLSTWAMMLAVGLSLFSGLRYFALNRPA